MPIYTHLFFPKALGWEGALAPLSSEIAAKALVTGICKQFHIQRAGPICFVQEAHPIPGREVGQPPLNVSPEPYIELYPVMEVVCLLGSFYHVA